MNLAVWRRRHLLHTSFMLSPFAQHRIRRRSFQVLPCVLVNLGKNFGYGMIWTLVERLRLETLENRFIDGRTSSHKLDTMHDDRADTNKKDEPETTTTVIHTYHGSDNRCLVDICVSSHRGEHKGALSRAFDVSAFVVVVCHLNPHCQLFRDLVEGFSTAYTHSVFTVLRS
jgi:hypothetical protein